jgi:hypothetical protein
MFNAKVISPRLLTGICRPEPDFRAGISKPSSGSDKQNKASVLGRTLKIPTIVLTAGLAT